MIPTSTKPNGSIREPAPFETGREIGRMVLRALGEIRNDALAIQVLEARRANRPDRPDLDGRTHC
jgi:hypothetical protein